MPVGQGTRLGGFVEELLGRWEVERLVLSGLERQLGRAVGVHSL